MQVLICLVEEGCKTVAAGFRPNWCAWPCLGRKCVSSAHSGQMSQDILDTTELGGGACPHLVATSSTQSSWKAAARPSWPTTTPFPAAGLPAGGTIQGGRIRGPGASFPTAQVLLPPSRPGGRGRGLKAAPGVEPGRLRRWTSDYLPPSARSHRQAALGGHRLADPPAQRADHTSATQAPALLLRPLRGAAAQ